MNEIRYRIKDLAISDSGFIFDPVSGAVFTTNSTGKSILNAMREGTSFSELEENLSNDFEVSREALKKDIEEFVEQLRSLRLLAPGNDLV